MAVAGLVLALSCGHAPGPKVNVDPPSTDSPVAGDSTADSEGGDSGEDSGPDSGVATDADADGYPAALDCNDTDATVYPGAPDLCDGVDQDCDGEAIPAASCGLLDEICDGAQYYWEDESSADPFGVGFGAILDGAPVLLAGMLNYNEEGFDSGGSSVAILSGLPPANHDWRESAVALWAGRDYSKFVYNQRVAGDFDGDGSDDMWLVTNDWEYDQEGAAWLIPGPSSDWNPKGDYVDSAASASWISAAPNDKIGWSMDAGDDLDHDGIDDLLLLTRGDPGGDGVLALIRGREALGGLGQSLLDEAWIATPYANISDVAMVPDLDGDGAMDVLTVHTQAALWLSGEAVLRCAGCAEEDVSGVVLAEDEAIVAYAATPTASTGDLNADGVEEIAIQSFDWDGKRDEGSCVLYIDGATTGAGEIADPALTTRVCWSMGGSGGLWSGADLDGDGVSEVVTSYRDDESDPHFCLIPSTRLALGARVELLDVSWCIDGLHFVSDDLNGDGYPEFIGSKDSQPDDAVQCGNTPVMLGFDIPWDDPSKW